MSRTLLTKPLLAKMGKRPLPRSHAAAALLTALAPSDKARAKLLGTSARTVARWRQQNKLPRVVAAALAADETLTVETYIRRLVPITPRSTDSN